MSHPLSSDGLCGVAPSDCSLPGQFQGSRLAASAEAGRAGNTVWSIFHGSRWLADIKSSSPSAALAKLRKWARLGVIENLPSGGFTVYRYEDSPPAVVGGWDGNWNGKAVRV